MAERVKGPREIRHIRFHLAPLLSTGAALSTVQGFASRQVTLSTTLAAGVTPADTTVLLDADPGVGATLTVDPGSVSAEEIFKVTAVTPSGGDFLCDISPMSAEQSHALGAAVDYQPGVTSSFLLDETPAPTDDTVDFAVQQGAHAQVYTLSVLGTADNGEVVEDETDIEVSEFPPSATVIKQPAETRDIAVDFSQWTARYSTTLVSATAFVARETTITTTVDVAGASAGATVLPLVAHPGVGALLIVNAAGPTHERLLVSAVGGIGPYTATVSALQFAHSSGETVTVYPGASTRVLTSTTASIQGTEAIFRSRLGQAGQSYWMVVLGTLGDGQVAQKTLRLTVSEL